MQKKIGAALVTLNLCRDIAASILLWTDLQNVFEAAVLVTLLELLLLCRRMCKMDHTDNGCGQLEMDTPGYYPQYGHPIELIRAD